MKWSDFRLSVSRVLCVWASVAILSGCATQSLPPDQLAKIRTIGVISAVGDTVGLTNIGPLVFNNNYSSGTIANWQPDDFFVRRATALLEKRYNVQALTYDRSAFRPEKLYSPGSQSLLARPDPTRRRLEDVVREQVEPQGLDAYVFISKSVSGFGTSNIGVGGLGVLRTPDIFSSRYNLYAIYQITVIDGRAHKILGVFKASYPDTLMSLNAGLMLEGPYRLVDRSWWAGSFDDLSEQQRRRMVEGLEKLIDDSLVVTLRDIKLID